MNYIEIQLVIVLVLGTDLPHRLHQPDVSPASKIFYSYALSMSTGIFSLSFLILISSSTAASLSSSTSRSSPNRSLPHGISGQRHTCGVLNLFLSLATATNFNFPLYPNNYCGVPTCRWDNHPWVCGALPRGVSTREERWQHIYLRHLYMYGLRG